MEDAGAKVVVCASNDEFDRLAALTGELPQLEQRVGLSLPASHPNGYHNLLSIGRDTPHPGVEVDSDDACCILYTSGTTATPKGVVLSHGAICANVEALTRAIPLTRSDVSLSVLPWSSSFGYTCELFVMLRVGGAIALSSGLHSFFGELGEVQPTVVVAVPQVLQAIHQEIARSLRSRPQMIRKLFATALELRRAEETRKLRLPERLALEAAERTVLAPIRHRLGGKLRYIVCGGATLSMETARYLVDVGLPVFEGYGLTEAGPVVATNRPGATRLGTVGRPIDGVSVEVDTDQGGEDGQGEIVVRGPSLMTGYHGHPDATADVLRDGGLRTGDLGFVDGEGYLHITGRLDEEYKLANGKHVVPSRLEHAIGLSPYIRAAVVCGEGREHNVAIVVANVDALNTWAAERELHFPDTAAMLDSSRVKRHIMAEIGEHSGSFRAYERIRDVVVVAESLSTEGGLLSASHQLRRAALMDKYADRLDGLA